MIRVNLHKQFNNFLCISTKQKFAPELVYFLHISGKITNITVILVFNLHIRIEYFNVLRDVTLSQVKFKYQINNNENLLPPLRSLK